MQIFGDSFFGIKFSRPKRASKETGDAVAPASQGDEAGFHDDIQTGLDMRSHGLDLDQTSYYEEADESTVSPDGDASAEGLYDERESAFHMGRQDQLSVEENPGLGATSQAHESRGSDDGTPRGREDRKSKDRKPRQKKRQKGRSLPLGVDVHAQGVSIVAAEVIAGEFVISEVYEQRHEGLLAPANRSTAVEVLAEVVGRLQTSERRCVLALPPAKTKSDTIARSPKMKQKDLMEIAEVKADATDAFGAGKRAMSLDRLDDRHVLLSMASQDDVLNHANLARAAGLKPIAVDTFWCGWRRASDADAILDLRLDLSSLCIFPYEVEGNVVLGGTHNFQAGIPFSTIAGKVGDILLGKRREHGHDVRTLAVAAKDESDLKAALDALKVLNGCESVPVVIGGYVNPPWAYAYGLAKWSLADLLSIAPGVAS